MPETNPPATPASDAQPPADQVARVRAELDCLDNRIHSLLMKRAKVVAGLRGLGKPAYRPGREAEILRRLWENHEGELRPRTIVRMWREMLAGTTAMQTKVMLAAFDPTRNRDVTAVAREHFGCLTPVIAHESAAAALDAVLTGAATLAVLPFPAGEDI